MNSMALTQLQINFANDFWNSYGHCTLFIAGSTVTLSTLIEDVIQKLEKQAFHNHADWLGKSSRQAMNFVLRA